MHELQPPESDHAFVCNLQQVQLYCKCESLRAMPRALRPPVSQKSIQPVCHSRMLLSRSVMAGQVASRSPAMCARSPAVISPPSSSPTRASTRRHGAARAHGSRTRHNECTRQTGRGGALDAGADVRPTGLLALAGEKHAHVVQTARRAAAEPVQVGGHAPGPQERVQVVLARLGRGRPGCRGACLPPQCLERLR